jgi:hypothetical protein
MNDSNIKETENFDFINQPFDNNRKYFDDKEMI